MIIHVTITHMNTDIYKTKLEEEKKLLEQELGSLGQLNSDTGEWEATPGGDGTPEADENDLADKAENYEERSSTMRVLNTRLSDVTRALTKIDNGTYGICEVSGNPISEARLLANPSARTSEEFMESAS